MHIDSVEDAEMFHLMKFYLARCQENIIDHVADVSANLEVNPFASARVKVAHLTLGYGECALELVDSKGNKQHVYIKRERNTSGQGEIIKVGAYNASVLKNFAQIVITVRILFCLFSSSFSHTLLYAQKRK